MEAALIVLGAFAGGFLGWLLFSKKRPLPMREWMEIYLKGYNEGIESAANVINDFGFDESVRETSVRWAGLIRQLKNERILESSKK